MRNHSMSKGSNLSTWTLTVKELNSKLCLSTRPRRNMTGYLSCSFWKKGYLSCSVQKSTKLYWFTIIKPENLLNFLHWWICINKPEMGRINSVREHTSWWEEMEINIRLSLLAWVQVGGMTFPDPCQPYQNMSEP